VAEKRKVEIMVAGIGWSPCSFGDVVAGDLFRLFEETGEPVNDLEGNTEFEASEDAHQMEDGTWCLTTKDEE
jgi:hypothetical protein